VKARLASLHTCKSTKLDQQRQIRVELHLKNFALLLAKVGQQVRSKIADVFPIVKAKPQIQITQPNFSF